MARNYYYLAGSLPMAVFGEKLPMTPEALDETVARLADPADHALFRKVALRPTAETLALPGAAGKFAEWENALRNAWLEFRRKERPDAGDFKRNYPDFFAEIGPGLAQAANAANPLDAEMILDRMRWNRLDELEAGHAFDFDRVCICKLKLLILAKYACRTPEAGQAALDGIVGRLVPDEKSSTENQK